MNKPTLASFNTLTFDVVGTLIDFEQGILDWFRPLLTRHSAEKCDEDILTTFAECEDQYQQKAPDKPFTAMLPLIYRDMAALWKIDARESEAKDFRDSIQTWPAFPDTVAALKELGTHYKLVAVTNADAWALQSMSATLGDPFDEHVTCDEVGVNKPSPRVFNYVLEKLATLGVRKADILHTAQSQYHDIVPAMELGFSTMWIERRHGKGSFGATPTPEQIAEPTFHATSMEDFVRQVQRQQI
ncbi:HAD family hydrolase [Vacuolonema iberomarrocanum]|uniref:HAD family hydrolase n=1 Tax=Vacuolonema iberomarrocanum TaxID=3454632 RepID=UPI001A012FA5|nr:HAD-IA family hydrolase [filamentous cyanobacterium LEGE 07170]